jgi:hypothetical protein
MTTLQIKILTCSITIAGMLALTACSSSTQSLYPTNSVPVSTTSVSPTSSPVLSPAATASSTTAPTAIPTKVTPPEASSAETTKQLKELLELAKQGKVPGIKYAAHTGMIDEIEKAWGTADITEPAGKGIYSTYSKKNTVFGSNKGLQVFDIRSNDPSLQKLTFKQIEQALGKPADTKVNGEDTIYIYNANDQFQLKFIVPKKTGKVDHISVFAPKDSVNLMAE